MPLAALPLLALLAAAGEPPPLPPPPLLEAPGAPETLPPSDAPDEPAEPAPRAPSHPPAGTGLDPWTTAFVQLGAVSASSLLLSVPLAYGNALSLGLCGCLLYPTAASYGVVALGNAVGDHEAPLKEPWLASVAVGAASSAAIWVGVLGLALMSSMAPPNTSAPSLAAGLFIGLIGAGALCGPSASALAAVAAWHIYAVPRAPGAPRELPSMSFPDAPVAMAF